VFHQQDGYSNIPDLCDELAQPLGFTRVKTRGWFIQQEKFRLGSQSPGNLQVALKTKWKPGRIFMNTLAQAYKFKKL